MALNNTTELKLRLNEILNALKADTIKINETNNFKERITKNKCEIINAIEKLILFFVDCILNGKIPSFRQLNYIAQIKNSRSGLPKDPMIIQRKQITLLIFTCSKIYRLLVTNSYAMRREIFYQHVELFGNQKYLDTRVNEITKILNCTEREINILTTSKGLVYGSLKIILPTQTIICSDGIKGLPNSLEGVKLQSDAKFCLVIEKDTIFQRLINEKFHELHGPTIIVTGRGVPDVNSRFLLSQINYQLSIPIFGLFDPDPFGIEILLTYRFGSLNKNHLKDILAIPHLKWIGVHPTDLIKFDCSNTLELTYQDRAKISSLLTRPCLKDHPAIIEQIKQLDSSSFKGEIEHIANISLSYLTDVYIPMKMSSEQFF